MNLPLALRRCIRLPAALLPALLAACASQPEMPAAAVPTRAAASAAEPVSKMSVRDRQALVAHHNKVRADVRVGPLKWSPVLASHAQDWADQLAATTCRMAHRPQPVYGENLFQGTAGYFSALDAARAWESEKKDYRGGILTESNWHPAGHYTQMVWRDTQLIGCGEALCNKMLIVACNYDPPGNRLGRRPY